MVDYTIPIKSVTERSIFESTIESRKNNTDITYFKVINSIRENTNYEELVKEFFKECCFINTENRISECVSILVSLSENNKNKDEKKQKFITNMGDILVNKIIPNSINVNKSKSDIEPLKESTQELRKIYENAGNKIKELDESHRVISNHNKLAKRFNINSYRNTCKYKGLNEVTESICDLVNTYDMPIHKKLNISLEETMYLYELEGVDLNRKDMVKNILEYYLANNSLISDPVYNYMTNVLENNSFLSKEDTSSVNYFFESNTFSSKISKLSKKMDGKYKEVLKDISECKSVTGVAVVIARVFNLIFSTFIVAGVTAFSTVTITISALLSLVVILGISPVIVINEIKSTIDDIKKRSSNLSPEEKRRADKVIKYTNEKIINNKNSVKESVDMLDQAIIDDEDMDPSVLSTEEPEYAFNMIKDIVKESKDFADSDDVKDIIKKYKAEQNKSETKLKRVLNKIYTKSPEKIIDDLPNIFSLLRNFAILSIVTIPAVGPALALVTFCADKFLSMKLKREQTDKILKYFKSEKTKVQSKIDKTSDDKKKERLEDYADCLDKCIEKIDDYNYNLHGEDEDVSLNDFLEEGSSITDSITMNEYFDIYHKEVYINFMRAYELIKSRIEVINTTEIDRDDVVYMEEPDNYFKNKTRFMQNCITPEGLVNVPIVSILLRGPLSETEALDLCTYVNQYLSKGYFVTSFSCNKRIYITFYWNKRIYLVNTEIEDKSITTEGSVLMSNIIGISAALDEMCNELNADNIVNELSKDIDIIAEDDINSVMNVLENSLLDNKEFIDSLKDYDFDAIANRGNCHVDYDYNRYSDDYNYGLDEAMIQLESMRVLRSIIEMKNNSKKNGDKDNKPVSKVKDVITNKAKEAKDKTVKVTGNIANKTKDGKIALTTNLKLASEAMKKKIQGLGTKEKEVSQSIDAAANGLRTGIEKAVTNDRREAIIKGSVVPSFSKLIKNGIMVAGTYAVSPVLAAITCIGGLAISKSLNKKERQMLLDEINIELQVVESEIDRVKDNDPKKYKQLLMYQRKLQRERQRIMYRVKLYARDKSSLIDPEY